jgi:hypothetical protein
VVLAALAAPAQAVPVAKREGVDLEIAISGLEGPRARASGPVFFQVEVRNRGPEAFPGGSIAVSLSTRVTEIAVVGRRSMRRCHPAGGPTRPRVVCALDRLGRGRSAVLALRAQVAPSDVGERLVVRVVAASEDGNP